jgi:hypothetical protein
MHAQVFTSIGQMEFFYDQAPDVMRSCSMALQLLSVCIGSYLSGAVVWVAGEISRRMGEGRVAVGPGGWVRVCVSVCLQSIANIYPLLFTIIFFNYFSII